MNTSAKPYLIVVGVDYSPASDLALEQAFDLALSRAPSEVHIVNVVRLYGNQALIDAPAEPGFASLSLDDARLALARYVDQRKRAYLEREGGRRLPRVLSHLRLEAPAEELAQIAADLDADLIVMGTHGRRGLSRLLLGSVAEAVVRLAPCPVFVVRPKVAHGAPSTVPQIEPPCPRCLETRRTSGGSEYWCEQHRERHGQRHTYHQRDRVGAETEMPLTYHR